MRYPNLFIVGAPRCGTTSLAYYLSQHPEVFFLLDQEPLFWAKDIIDRPQIQNEKRYAHLFSNTRNKKWVGEKSTFYLYSKEAPYLIKKNIPNAKILILLRDPVEMARSIHNSFFNSVWFEKEDLCNFEEAISEEGARRARSSLRFESYFYTELGMYHKYVARYMRIFGKKNVKIVFFHELKKNPKLVYKEVLSFLKLNEYSPNLAPKNVGTIDYNTKQQRFIFKLKKNAFPIFLLLKSLLPIKVRFLLRQQKRIQTKKPISKEFEVKLRKKFLPQIKKLEELLNKDLTVWKK